MPAQGQSVPQARRERSLLVVAGEVSGDMHAAQVLAALRARDPSLRAWGIGGDRLRSTGMDVLYDVRDMAVMGLGEVLRRYGFFRRVFREVVAAARERRPDAALLVDYPGFNLPLAAQMRRLGIRVLYYICPQVWAWRRGRIRQMARVVDRLLVIFPFEPTVFYGTGLRVDFVGHPLVDETRRAKAAPLAKLPWQGEPRVALLPGSRREEVERILPVMCGAAHLLQQQIPSASFLVAAPYEEMAALARRVMERFVAMGLRGGVVSGCTGEVLRQAEAAWVASGTATVEAALMGCLMVVVYKTSPLTYALGRLLVRVPHIGMVNLVAGKEVCPEYVQGRARPAELARALHRLLTDANAREIMRRGLEEVGRALGEGGAAERAAEIILSELNAAA